MSLPPAHRFNDSRDGAFLRERPSRGEPAATLVLVHGLGESGLCFEAIWHAQRLQSYRLLAWDLPGYGKSAWAERPLTLAEHARFVAERVAEENRRRPWSCPTVLVGHSLGGVVGLLLCEQLAGTTPASAPSAAWKGPDLFVNVEGNVSLSDCTFSSRAATHSLEGWCDGGLRDLADELYLEGVQEPSLRTYHASILMCDPATFHANARELVELSRAEGMAQRLAALDVPVEYVYGEPSGTGRHSRDLLSAAGVPCHRVRHSGHWPFIDHPDEFSELLASLIERRIDGTGT